MKEMWSRVGGNEILLQGNQALARGALEGGVRFCAGYPGNPSSEIIETLVDAARHLPLYVEWSTNEKVALEAATAASFSGCRALVSMKQNGVNVASDFLTNLSLSGLKAGLVLVACDDPTGVSSTNEEDSRIFARLAEVPLLEPSTPQEALEMIRWAFELSETIGNPVMLRSVSRLSHMRTNVQMGDLPDSSALPYFDPHSPFHTFPVVKKHQGRRDKLRRAGELFEESPFNRYEGPESPELLVISSGCAWNYAVESVEILGLQGRVGVLNLGTTWPLPVKLLTRYLKTSEQILFAEDNDSFLEDNVKSLAAQLGKQVGVKTFFGKSSGHLPFCGELTPAAMLEVLGTIFRIGWKNDSYDDKISSLLREPIIPREFGFCPGCPHRGSFFAIKTALAWDDRNGFVSGDIGCYTMGIWPTGFNQSKSAHAMGSGLGLACGYGKLERFGFNQPVITVCGDSTFFHAALPALVNARFNNADILLVILDNSATAMTGFQPHPGTGVTAMGDPAEAVDMQALCRSLGVEVEVADPYDPAMTAWIIYQLMQKSGPRGLILRRKCALIAGRQEGFPYTMSIDQTKCLGEACGCGRYCTRIFRCPGLTWRKEAGKAEIDEVICVGCGVCMDICPQKAIVGEDKRERPANSGT